MATVLRDILIDINHADFEFENSLPLINDSKQNIGNAELDLFKDLFNEQYQKHNSKILKQMFDTTP